MDNPDFGVRVVAAYKFTQHLLEPQTTNIQLFKKVLPLLTEGTTNVAEMKKTFPATYYNISNAVSRIRADVLQIMPSQEESSRR